MQQCFKRPSRLWIVLLHQLRVRRNYSGEEMVLIGESGNLQPTLFSSLRQAGPLDVSGNICVTY